MPTQRTPAPLPAVPETPQQEHPRTPAAEAPAPAHVTFWLDIDGSIRQIDTPPGDEAGLDATLDADSLVSTSLFHHIHEGDLLPVFRGVAELVEGQQEVVPVDFHLRTESGLWRAARGTMRLCFDGRTIAGLLVTLQFLAALT